MLSYIWLHSGHFQTYQPTVLPDDDDDNNANLEYEFKGSSEFVGYVGAIANESLMEKVRSS